MAVCSRTNLSASLSSPLLPLKSLVAAGKIFFSYFFSARVKSFFFSFLLFSSLTSSSLLPSSSSSDRQTKAKRKKKKRFRKKICSFFLFFSSSPPCSMVAWPVKLPRALAWTEDKKPAFLLLDLFACILRQIGNFREKSECFTKKICQNDSLRKNRTCNIRFFPFSSRRYRFVIADFLPIGFKDLFSFSLSLPLYKSKTFHQFTRLLLHRKTKTRIHIKRGERKCFIFL